MRKFQMASNLFILFDYPAVLLIYIRSTNIMDVGGYYVCTVQEFRCIYVKYLSGF